MDVLSCHTVDSQHQATAVMNNQQTIEDFIQQALKWIPEDLRQFRADMEQNVRSGLDGLLRKMDLVTREEYDIQLQLLKNTRSLVDELSARVTELEQQSKE